MERVQISFGGGSTFLGATQRLILGVVVLLLVDVIWVMSSELTEYIFQHEKYDKPFFSTYVKTSMFLVFLFGFVCWVPWHERCLKPETNQYTLLATDPETVIDEVVDDNANEPVLSPPSYIPINYEPSNSGNESDDSVSQRSVRFSKLAEVRHLAEHEAAEALFARLSYHASIQAEQQAYRLANRLTPRQTAKLALTFCLMWFVANYTYQLALSNTEVGIVNVLSAASGLFTLILASIFPSVPADKFTLSKLIAVLISFTGVAIVSLTDSHMESKKIPLGTVFALVSAFFYAAYLVFLRKKVDHEDKLDIPMFFGFVGLFNLVMLWPMFFLLHYGGIEEFSWPTKRQWLFLAFNGIIGTVFSEVLWLWGSFLTSSLIATLAISLTIPMSMVADILFKNVSYSTLFYLGTIPMIISFFAVNFLAHYENWDPVMDFFRKIAKDCCPTRSYHSPSVATTDPQHESLIDEDDDDEDPEDSHSSSHLIFNAEQSSSSVVTS